MGQSDNDNRTPSRQRSEPQPAPTIDDVDRAIIRLLQRDGRMSNTEIGREVNLTETTIRKRIGRLLGEGLINVVAVPTPRAVGMTVSALIGISVQLGELQAISDRLAKVANVRYVGLSTGRYDLIVEAFFEDNEHLLAFVAEELGSDPAVRQVETSLILRIAKFSYEWEIP
jgi:Lrp/AsnC family transcriptional regulator for asnA, asnC and gidA